MFFSSILQCCSTADHSKEYLTKFGSTQNMKIENLKYPFMFQEIVVNF